jgi:2-polyprenyl-3-methyl-5-hydroxy-6-metoxy-1,4-benzoquinol methylase
MLLQDRWALHIQAYTAYRYALVEPFLISGPIRSLNIGSGGGVETLRLLRKGNSVTSIDTDDAGAAQTRARVVRNGFADRHVGHVGHVLDVSISETFDCILMCEVLEHIKRDVETIHRLSNWLVPGGRLILSTPTASYGQLPGDVVTREEDDEHHVRVGYDGPELDEMLKQADFIPLRRTYNSYALMRIQQTIELGLRHRATLVPFGIVFGIASRPFMPLLDAVRLRPLTQLTLATKRHAPTS